VAAVSRVSSLVVIIDDRTPTMDAVGGAGRGGAGGGEGEDETTPRRRDKIPRIESGSRAATPDRLWIKIAAAI